MTRQAHSVCGHSFVSKYKNNGDKAIALNPANVKFLNEIYKTKNTPMKQATTSGLKASIPPMNVETPCPPRNL